MLRSAATLELADIRLETGSENPKWILELSYSFGYRFPLSGPWSLTKSLYI